MNFGLHDYNLGVDGVREYTDEYRTGLQKVFVWCICAPCVCAVCVHVSAVFK